MSGLYSTPTVGHGSPVLWRICRSGTAAPREVHKAGRHPGGRGLHSGGRSCAPGRSSACSLRTPGLLHYLPYKELPWLSDRMSRATADGICHWSGRYEGEGGEVGGLSWCQY